MLPLPTYYIHIVIDIYTSFLAKTYACDSFFLPKTISFFVILKWSRRILMQRLPIHAWDCSGIFLGISHWIRKAEDDDDNVVVVSTKNPWYVIGAFEAVSHPCHSWTLKGHLYSPNATKSLCSSSSSTREHA